jgi:hypothetical protein
VSFTCDDLKRLTDSVIQAWRAGAACDWTAPAGRLEWSCRQTAEHAIDTVLAPAFFLASRNEHAYPAFDPFTLGAEPAVDVMIEGLQTATRILVAVVEAAEPDARALIWAWPTPAVGAPIDFVPRAGLELILHAYDVCQGLGVRFDPDAEVCEHLRQHTAAWPFWASDMWSPLSMRGDAWTDLLHASGRT